jgi:hypothetical protein
MLETELDASELFVLAVAMLLHAENNAHKQSKKINRIDIDFNMIYSPFQDFLFLILIMIYLFF